MYIVENSSDKFDIRYLLNQNKLSGPTLYNLSVT